MSHKRGRERVDALLDNFRQHLEQERMLATSTIRRYIHEVGRFANGLGTDEKQGLKEACREDVKRFLSGEGDPSRFLWNIRLAALRAFYSYLQEQGEHTNPTTGIKALKVKSIEKVPLNFQELLALLWALSEARFAQRNSAVFQLLFHSGLRVSELVSLNMDQLDLQNSLLLDVQAKGGKRLVISINAVALTSLSRYLEQRPGLLKDESEQAVFLSTRGTRLSIRAVQDFIRAAGQKAKISRTVTPHLLRHSHATHLLRLGTPLNVVQKKLGHASIKTTQLYLHTNMEDKQVASKMLETAWLAYLENKTSYLST